MGMYTEIFVNCELRKDVPEEVVHDLRILFDESFITDGFVSDIPKQDKRLRAIGNCSSYYFQPRATSAMWYDDIGRSWYICSRSDLKNYDGEIEAFFAWLGPYVAANPGEFIGYHRYEEDDAPVLVFKREGE